MAVWFPTQLSTATGIFNPLRQAVNLLLQRERPRGGRFTHNVGPLLCSKVFRHGSHCHTHTHRNEQKSGAFWNSTTCPRCRHLPILKSLDKSTQVGSSSPPSPHDESNSSERNQQSYISYVPRAAGSHCPVTVVFAHHLQGANPVSVKVTLRGKKYDVKGATSVEDVQKSVEEQAGLAKEQQVRTGVC